VSRPTDRDAAGPIAPERSNDIYIRHVAHDLRAPLNAIVGWAELVKAGHLSPEDAMKAGTTIVRHGRMLSERLNDAFDVWRLDAGLLEVATHTAPVAPAVRAAVDASRPEFDHRHVSCTLAVSGDGVATFDAQRLVQALRLLLADAGANTAAGDRVDVGLGVVGGQIEIRIEGGGRMPDASAFERTPADTRADPATRAYSFGLSLARALVSMQGGTLRVTGAGSQRVAFIIELPTADAQASGGQT
jgi:signal transduction histidine kinase